MNGILIFIGTFTILAAAGAQSLCINRGKYYGAFAACLMATSANLFLFKAAPSANAYEMAMFVLGGPCGLVAVMYMLRGLHIPAGGKGKSSAETKHDAPKPDSQEQVDSK